MVFVEFVADAMLEGLKKGGSYLRVGSSALVKLPFKCDDEGDVGESGYLVFIPEEKG